MITREIPFLIFACSTFKFCVQDYTYSVTDDFYKYYGLSKSDVYPVTVNKKQKNITLTIDGVTYSGILEEK